MEKEKSNMTIGKKSFIISILILFALMLISGILTVIIPAGEYDRTLLEDGKEIIVPDSYETIDDIDYPFYRWLTAPIEILWGEDSTVIIFIIVFLLVIGGSFYVLNYSKILDFILKKIIRLFNKRKYLLLFSIVFLFMFIGSFVGIFEEIVPLVPIMITLSFYLGWDSLTGLGMSILATGFGFAAGVMNPFTVAVAQKLAGLPVYSGFGFRILIFILVYAVVSLFLYIHVRKIEKDPTKSLTYHEDKIIKESLNTNIDEDTNNKSNNNKALIWFGSCIGIMFLFIFSTTIFNSLSDILLPIIGFLFLVGGIGSGLFAGLGVKELLRTFGKGALSLSPAIILILMASSIKHIMTSGGIMDTILYYSSNTISDYPPYISVILIFALVLVLNFFIGSGSAKAFLVIPIIIPLVDLLGINRQIAVLGFTLGDGFSNMFYPTNAVLLISLGLTVVNYPKWLRWTYKLQIIVLATSVLVLYLAMLINYGPY